MVPLEMFGYGIFDLILRNSTDDCLFQFSSFEKKECGDAQYAVVRRDFRILIDVEFYNLHLIFVNLRQVFYRRGNHMTWCTPNCPKIYENGKLTLENFLLKTVI